MSLERTNSQMDMEVVSPKASYAELGEPAREAADRHRQHIAALLVSRGCLPELDSVTPEVASDAA
jgi:hypothetical protein